MANMVAKSGNISKTIGLIAMKFGTDIDGAQRMIDTDFGDPVIFPLAPS